MQFLLHLNMMIGLILIIAGLFVLFPLSLGEILPRGIRNNNPGNLRKTADKWDGLDDDQNDKEFFVFVSPFYGIRALAKTLHNYKVKHSINTIAGIIQRFAPAGENDSLSYAQFIAGQLGFPVYHMFDIDVYLVPLIKSIIQYENGQQPFDDKLITSAVDSIL